MKPSIEVFLVFIQFIAFITKAQDYHFVYGDTAYMNGGWIKDSLIKNGTTYAYYDSAKTLLREKNEFKNYKLDGVRQYWGRKRITPPGEYEFVEYEPKVYLSQEREFKHGELLTTKFYFLGGQLEAIYTYVEDFVDTERHFYPGGEFHYEIKHKRYGMYDGEYIKYFSDGTVKERSFYKNNHLDSIQTEYFENGNPWKETYHGKSEGIKWEKQFYRNGNPVWLKCRYPDGTIYHYSYHPNGQFASETFYKSGWGLIQHGTSIHYDSLGRQDYVQSYIDGKKNGVWKIWYADGHLREIKTYSDGLLVGKYFLYSENPPHKLIEKKWYIKGELVKEKTYSKN